MDTAKETGEGPGITVKYEYDHNRDMLHHGFSKQCALFQDIQVLLWVFAIRQAPVGIAILRIEVLLCKHE